MHSASSQSVALSLTILASLLSALCLGGCAAPDKDVHEARVSPSDYRPGGYRRYVNLATRHHSVLTGVIRDVRIYERSKVTYTLVLSANKRVRVLPSEVDWCEKGLSFESHDELYTLARAPFDGHIDPVAPDWNHAVALGPGLRPLEIPIAVTLCPAGEKPDGFHDHHVFYPDSKGGSQFRTTLPPGSYRVFDVSDPDLWLWEEPGGEVKDKGIRWLIECPEPLVVPAAP